MDYLFRITVRGRRKLQIKYLAEKRARKTRKPIIYFNSIDDCIIDHQFEIDNGVSVTNDLDTITINIKDFANSNLKPDSCILVLSETLEYVDKLDKIIPDLQRVCGGDLYIVGIEKTAPRTFYDYRIKNIFDEPYYLPEDNDIEWEQPNELQKNIQWFYKRVFTVLPESLFLYDPIKTV